MKKFLCVFFLALAAISANAQDDFDPPLPGEPNAQYKVTVGISHSAAGTVSGGGSYASGRQITIRRNDASFSSSSTVYYKFKYWTLNGKEYTSAGKETSFTYTVGTQNAEFKAVYEVEDPDNVTSKLYLVADPADACTFNRSSGQRYLEGNSVYLYYNVTSSSFAFEGWYEGDKLITKNRYFYYDIGEDDATLTARFTYTPAIPGEPGGGSQENVDNVKKGDVNGDTNVTLADIALLISYLNGKTPSNFVEAAAKIDDDDDIDKDDVTALINLIFNK